MKTLFHWIIPCSVGFAALLTVGCASSSSQRTASTPAPSASPAPTATSVASLAGVWRGWMEGSGTTSPVTVTVKPDGTYTSEIGGTIGSGNFKVANGTITASGHLSGGALGADRASTAQLGTKDGKPAIVGEGRSDRGPYTYRLQKVN
jgi:hypothetical protein